MPISILQAAQTSATATSTTIALAFPNALTAGSFIYWIGGQVNNGTNTMTAADSQSNPYVATLDNRALSTSAMLSHGASSSASAGGANTVTVTYSATTTFRSLTIMEIAGTSGLDLSAPGGLYHNSAFSSSGTALSSGTLTPSVANGLAVGGCLDGNLAAITLVPGAGFTDIVGAGNILGSALYWQYTTGANHGDAAFQIYSTTSNVPVLFTLSGSDSLAATVGALFAPAAASNTASIAWVS